MSKKDTFSKIEESLVTILDKKSPLTYLKNRLGDSMVCARVCPGTTHTCYCAKVYLLDDGENNYSDAVNSLNEMTAAQENDNSPLLTNLMLLDGTLIPSGYVQPLMFHNETVDALNRYPVREFGRPIADGIIYGDIFFSKDKDVISEKYKVTYFKNKEGKFRENIVNELKDIIGKKNVSVTEFTLTTLGEYLKEYELMTEF